MAASSSPFFWFIRTQNWRRKCTGTTGLKLFLHWVSSSVSSVSSLYFFIRVVVFAWFLCLRDLPPRSAGGRSTAGAIAGNLCVDDFASSGTQPMLR